MRAIVLVGGEGTRLRPLTLRTPKALVPVLNRPLLERLLLHLRHHGVTAVTLAMTRRNEAVREALGDGRALDLRLTYAYEDTPLGSGGAIASAAAEWDGPPAPFLVCNGDILTDLDITAMVAAHRARGAALTISLHQVEDPSPFGVVALEEDGRISRFVEKPPRAQAPSHWINAGTWLFEPALLAELDATQFNRVEDQLFPQLAQSGRGIYGFRWDGYWMDVGRPQQYRDVNLELAGGACPALLPDGWPPSGVATDEATIDLAAVIDPPVLLGAGTTVEPGAVLRGPVVAGAGCDIEAGTLVEQSVLWDGVSIGPRAIVRRSVLASGVTIEAGAVVEDAVLAHDTTVAAGLPLPPDAAMAPAERSAPDTATPLTASEA